MLRIRRTQKRKAAELARLFAALDAVASERPPARRRTPRVSLGAAR